MNTAVMAKISEMNIAIVPGEPSDNHKCANFTLMGGAATWEINVVFYIHQLNLKKKMKMRD